MHHARLAKGRARTRRHDGPQRHECCRQRVGWWWHRNLNLKQGEKKATDIDTKALETTDRSFDPSLRWRSSDDRRTRERGEAARDKALRGTLYIFALNLIQQRFTTPQIYEPFKYYGLEQATCLTW